MLFSLQRLADGKSEIAGGVVVAVAVEQELVLSAVADRPG
jgi:hypothetical protein